jgi:hypothetical protein
MKTIRHSWRKHEFLAWICSKCGVHKVRALDSPSRCIYLTKDHNWIGYNLPECKSTYHNDKF